MVSGLVLSAGVGQVVVAELRVLAELDSLEVASRSSLGRHLITMLEEVADTPAQEVAWRQRRIVFGGGRQICFGVCSRFDDTVRGAFSCWAQLRHHDLQLLSGEVDDSVTVAVLLTPRPDGHRRWAPPSSRYRAISP